MNLRHFLDIDLIDSDTIKHLINLGHKLKKTKKNKKFLHKKILGMIFEKPSTRTRLSFEIGMKELEGEVVVLDQNDTQLGRGESIQDTIRVMSKYVDLIMYRGFSEERLKQIVKSSEVPIINGLTDKSHPCQIMADLMTLEEKFSSLNDLTIVWIGDGNNVCNSWIHANKHFNFKLKIATPKGYEPDKKQIRNIKNLGKSIEIYNDPFEAVDNADVLITDTWVSMGMKDEVERKKKFKKFQVNEKLMSYAKKNAFFLHCLPAHRGNEVSAEVINGPQSLVWEEAHNRLHVQKAILLWCMYMDG
ncbi:MAG: ornithine carbamoyltransferase [Rickettsiales bacterium]|nr:ornithine carbamoyltransferase [Rickettsiales bacterium]|tara:strand:+ start:47 stop:955 length:909 start_codon:yes stop_codon:yes gene_type:complete